MRLAYPDFLCTFSKARATWIGPLQPTALSPVYRIRIDYELLDFPKVKVLSPQLKLHSEHKNLPHVYREGDLLCLHYDTEWRTDLLIAFTVLQWISAWLYFYEIWLATSLWLGEGTHADAPQHRAS